MAHYYGKHDGVKFFAVYRDSGNIKLREFESDYIFNPEFVDNAPENTNTFTIYGMRIGTDVYSAIASYAKAHGDEFQLWHKYDDTVRAPFSLTQ